MKNDALQLFRGPFGHTRLEPLLRGLPAVAYLGLIHFLSSMEGGDLPPVIDDRIAHFLEYFGLAVLLYVAASAFDRIGRPWTVYTGVVLFAAVYGALDEWHQSFVPGRDSSLKDLAFDVAGAASAALLIRWLAWRKVNR